MKVMRRKQTNCLPLVNAPQKFRERIAFLDTQKRALEKWERNEFAREFAEQIELTLVQNEVQLNYSVAVADLKRNVKNYEEKKIFSPISGINHINLSNQTYVDKKTIVQIKKFKWKNTENVEETQKDTWA